MSTFLLFHETNHFRRQTQTTLIQDTKSKSLDTYQATDRMPSSYSQQGRSYGSMNGSSSYQTSYSGAYNSNSSDSSPSYHHGGSSYGSGSTSTSTSTSSANFPFVQAIPSHTIDRNKLQSLLESRWGQNYSVEVRD
jgi:hypothetical protein